MSCLLPLVIMLLHVSRILFTSSYTYIFFYYLLTGPSDRVPSLLCVYGGKQAAVVCIQPTEDSHDIIILSDMHFSDWIWDVAWLNDQVSTIFAFTSCLVFILLYSSSCALLLAWLICLPTTFTY